MNRSRSPLTSLLALIVIPAAVALGVTMLVLTMWDRQQEPDYIMLPTHSGTAMITPRATYTSVSSGTAEEADGGDTNAQPEPTNTEETADADPGCENVIHVIQEGETIGFLSEQYDVSIEDITLVNQMANPEFSPDFVSIDQEVIIPVCGVPTPTTTAQPTDTPEPTRSIPTPIPTSTEPPPGVVAVEVARVLNIGDITSEAVELINRGSSVARLGGWTLVNEESDTTFEFPELNLFPQGAITVHTGAGEDTAIDVYWGREEAVWESGDVVLLYDDDGELMHEFEIP